MQGVAKDTLYDEQLRNWPHWITDRSKMVVEKAKKKQRPKSRPNRVLNDQDVKQRMVLRAFERARRKGVPFDISVEDIHIPERCPMLGIKMMEDKHSSPSLDRLVPELGYVKGNVVVISQRANTLKGSANVEELEDVVRDLYSIIAYMKAHKMVSDGGSYLIPATLTASLYRKGNRHG